LNFPSNLDEKLQSNKTNKILVHCSAGISRSPTLVLAYMIKKYQMKFEDAFNKMRQLRQIVDPNVSFILQLRDWETKCLSAVNETTEDHSSNNNNSRSTYCGSSSKTKIDVKSHSDAAITVN
jgi:protein-tyrosine phosphatase